MNVVVTTPDKQTISVQPVGFRVVPQITAQTTRFLVTPQVDVQPESLNLRTMVAPSIRLMSTTSVLGLPGPQGPQGPPGPPSDQIYVSDTPPSSPQINDLWVDTA